MYIIPLAFLSRPTATFILNHLLVFLRPHSFSRSSPLLYTSTFLLTSWRIGWLMDNVPSKRDSECCVKKLTENAHSHATPVHLPLILCRIIAGSRLLLYSLWSIEYGLNDDKYFQVFTALTVLCTLPDLDHYLVFGIFVNLNSGSSLFIAVLFAYEQNVSRTTVWPRPTVHHHHHCYFLYRYLSSLLHRSNFRG